jgi:hypothetical protein
MVCREMGMGFWLEKAEAALSRQEMLVIARNVHDYVTNDVHGGQR